MYISELKLWNFRKYGADDFDLTDPHLTVPSRIQQASAKLRNVFVKALLWC